MNIRKYFRCGRSNGRTAPAPVRLRLTLKRHSAERYPITRKSKIADPGRGRCFKFRREGGSTGIFEEGEGGETETPEGDVLFGSARVTIARISLVVAGLLGVTCGPGGGLTSQLRRKAYGLPSWHQSTGWIFIIRQTSAIWALRSTRGPDLRCHLPLLRPDPDRHSTSDPLDGCERDSHREPGRRHAICDG